ncbi:MAG: MiaB/RimO family radical SAM methylthiotransferase, partial [Planctomycetes bacterium]|nr:MiaB/RimO family radical SAM methylthiotransferase [Planctomycetota bacterium]
MIFALRTFGCKTNQYEAEAIREQLLAGGHREVAEVAAAEVLIVNTCTVTGRADATWRNAVARARRENPGVRVVLTGCAVDVNPRAREEFQVEAVFRNQDKGLVASYFAAEAGAPLPASGGAGENAGGAHDNFALAIGRFAGHSRAFLKIQDGCDNRCSYCVIPFARGAGRSRPQAAVLAEAARLVAAGYQEIVLTGINIGAYHDGDLALAGLVRRLAALPGVGRLRLGSVEPQEVTGELIAAMAECPNVCPHLHLPLQSGSEGVLRRMNRKYGLSEFMAALGRLRAALPRPAVTTDLIVGFPGETAAEAAETLATVRAAGFARAHVFLFSPRA